MTRETYMNQKWEDYGYQDYVTYQEYLGELVKRGELDEETRESVAKLGYTRLYLRTGRSSWPYSPRHRAGGYPGRKRDRRSRGPGNDGAGSSTGFDGWYNLDYANQEMALAVEELRKSPGV